MVHGIVGFHCSTETLRRLRQGYLEFEASLGYRVRPCLKAKRNRVKHLPQSVGIVTRQRANPVCTKPCRVSPALSEHCPRRESRDGNSESVRENKSLAISVFFKTTAWAVGCTSCPRGSRQRSEFTSEDSLQLAMLFVGSLPGKPFGHVGLILVILYNLNL